jgi:hypothetical protein
MSHYFIQWGHLYVIHFGVWVTLLCGMDVHENGLPKLKDLLSKLKTALIMACVLSIFSSHSHHYLTNILPKI